ncbi:MAG: AAA family ATPase [Pseudomonadota bacterium]
MGFTVITGGIGCGKTTLIHSLLGTLNDDVTVGLVSNVREDSGELLNWVLMAFNQPIADMSYPLLYQKFENFVKSEFGAGRRVVLIIDEAQNLGLKTLEELRLLFNINTSKEQLLQLILVGQPELRRQLQSPELVQFTQRISSDFHLEPLPDTEVKNYIMQRIAIAGGERALFSDEACQLIAEASQGIPRTINVLCDRCLTYAFALSAPLVSVTTVQQVLHDKEKYGIFQTGTGELPQDRLRAVPAPHAVNEAH